MWQFQVTHLLTLLLPVFSQLELSRRLQNSFSVPYVSSSWSLYGSAIIDSHCVRLTPDKPSRSGGIYNTVPISSHNWLAQLSFHIHGSGDSLYGDGFALWYVNETISQGSVFGAKDFFKGLAIFFDTYANQNGEHAHEHPYISAMINDGTRSYDHDRDGTHTEFAGCSTPFRGPDRVTASIRYEKRHLKVTLQYDHDDSVINCFDAPDVDLPTGYFFGLSAATGDLTDNHDIFSFVVSEIKSDVEIDSEELARIIPSAGGAEAEREHVPDVEPSSKVWRILWFLFKWSLLATLLIGLCIFAYRQYNQRQFRHKRLY